MKPRVWAWYKYEEPDQARTLYVVPGYIWRAGEG